MWYTITMGILIGLAAILVIAFFVIGISLNKDIKANSPSSGYMSLDDIKASQNAELSKMQKQRENKKIVKGAVVGSIVAGAPGAIVGATIAKNNTSQKK